MINISKYIEYFYSNYVNINNFFNEISIITTKRHIYYQNVYVFIDRLKNFVDDNIDEQRVKDFFSNYLKKDVIIWKKTKYNNESKKILRLVNLNIWYFMLIRRFKTHVSIVLQILQSKRYIIIDTRNERIFRVYVQNIFRHVKIVEFFSFFNQMTLTWSNFDLKFRAHILKSKSNIEFNVFLKQFDEKTNIWRDLVVKRFFDIINTNVDKNNRSINKQFFNKQNERQNEFFQSFENRFVFQFQFQYSFDDWYYNSNSIYQNQNFQYRQSLVERFNQRSQTTSLVVAIILSSTKRFLQIIFENASNSRKQNQTSKFSTNVEKFIKFDKTKVYVVDENEKKTIENSFENANDENYVNYYMSKELNYYELDFYNKSNEFVFYFVTSNVFFFSFVVDMKMFFYRIISFINTWEFFV